MFFICSYNGSKYGVKDTRDGVVEWYTKEELMAILNKGVTIRGINGSGLVFCKSEDVLADFLDSIRPKLAKLKLLGIHDRESIVNEVKKLAFNIGVIPNTDNLVIDIQTQKAVISGHYNTILDYNPDSKKFIDKLDVCNKDVSQLSKLGTEAFKHITLKVGNSTVLLSEVVEELKEILPIYYNLDDITYIGITPSNRMFKLYIDGVGYVSMKVDTKDYIKSNMSKILGTKVVKFGYFNKYINEIVHSSKDWGISKMSVKNFSSSIDLKAKYPTLHDVYRKFC